MINESSRRLGGEILNKKFKDKLLKSIFKKIKVIALVSFLLIANGYAQETHKIKGTIGNEKMDEEKIVICVLGTKACMPVNIDTSMNVKYQNKDTKLTDLPFGLYLEADIITDKTNRKMVRDISIDETKTVICFTELKKEQEFKLSDVLRKIKGVNDFEIHSESGQVYIEYTPQIIAYKDLESAIKKEGFELE